MVVFSATSAPLRPEDAAAHIGETATVCGMAASAEYETRSDAQHGFCWLLQVGLPPPCWGDKSPRQLS
jgi:hypothetical protein